MPGVVHSVGLIAFISLQSPIEDNIIEPALDMTAIKSVQSFLHT